MAHQHLRRYLAKLLFATIVPLLALAGLLTYQVVSSERETRLQAMQDLARTLSSAVDAEVNRTVLALQLLATSSAIDRLDLEEIRGGFEEAKGLHGRWSSMSLFKADGTRLLNLRVPPGQPIPTGRISRNVIELKRELVDLQTIVPQCPAADECPQAVNYDSCATCDASTYCFVPAASGGKMRGTSPCDAPAARR